MLNAFHVLPTPAADFDHLARCCPDACGDAVTVLVGVHVFLRVRLVECDVVVGGGDGDVEDDDDDNVEVAGGGSNDDD